MARFGEDHYNLARQVPDMVDLTVMAVESGMGIDGAFRFVADRLEGALAEKCRRASREAAEAADPEAVWFSLCSQVGDEEFTRFVSALRGAVRQGTSVGGVLRQLADDIRNRRLQRARQEAARLPAQLTFVNVVLVPCLVVELLAFMMLPGWLVLFLLAPGVAVLVGRYLAQSRTGGPDRQDRQMADALWRVSASVRAGNSLEQALTQVAGTAPEGLDTGLTDVTQALRAGQRPAAAFDALRERFGRREINLLVAAVQAHTDASAGGSLADVLDRAAGLIAERVRIRQEIRALTAQAQFSTYLLTGIPLALAGLGRLVGISLSWIAQDLHVPVLIPALVVVVIYGVQSGVHRVTTQILHAVDRFMP